MRIVIKNSFHRENNVLSFSLSVCSHSLFILVSDTLQVDTRVGGERKRITALLGMKELIDQERELIKA